MYPISLTAACHLIEYGAMTAVAADHSDHSEHVASIFNYFSLPLVQGGSARLISYLAVTRNYCRDNVVFFLVLRVNL